MILNALVEKLKRRSKDDFKGRHFEATLILQAVSWYLRYPLSYRDIEELFLERGLEVDHSTLNRWVLAYAPLIERRLRTFRKPHCGSIRVDETYIKIRGQWRYLYRAIDKHGTPGRLPAHGQARPGRGQALLPQDAAGGAAALPRPDRHRWCGVLSTRHRGSPERRAPGAHAGPLRDQAPAAGDRERPLPGQAAHAAGGLLPGLPHGAAHDPGLRGHAVAAQGLRLCRRAGRCASRTGCSRSASVSQRLTKCETGPIPAHPAAYARVCDTPLL